MDDANDKLIGILGLGDPVYALGARDEWIGWDRQAKKDNLYHVMNAFVLGAVPPYSYLLGGKLVAMMACSNEVRRAFRRRYSGKKSRDRSRVFGAGICSSLPPQETCGQSARPRSAAMGNLQLLMKRFLMDPARERSRITQYASGALQLAPVRQNARGRRRDARARRALLKGVEVRRIDIHVCVSVESLTAFE